MCGIAGYFNLSLREEERAPLLQRMCDSIVHRGPDDEGYYADEHVGLGMRRLSIIDVAGGHQPIGDETGDRLIIYNGEVYNFGDLRGPLERKGHRFSTHTDTEVVLRQYMEEGPACVRRFNGMFAFAIWDRPARRLFLARDHLGIKPLYYYWDGQRLLFASEIKALLASGCVPRTLNPQALWDYLTFRYVPQPESIWANVHKLLPGHTLTIAADRPEPVVERYWDIPYDDDVVARSDADYSAEFERLFLDAVRLRLIADVPVGILLSGGLDSSCVAAAIAEVHNARLSSFSVAFENSPSTNELPFARQVAQRVGTDHHEIVIGEREFREFLPQMVYYTDEPLADLASVPLYYVSRLARERVKVVLSGEGSDEILGGYDFDALVQRWDRMRRFQRLPKWLRRDAAMGAMRRLSGRMTERLEQANTPPHELLAQRPCNMTDLLGPAEKRALCKYAPPVEDSMAAIHSELARVASHDPLHQALYVYCQSWLVEDLLMKADKMTMANSIELRVPFLDPRLVEWTARTPGWVKVGHNGHGRYETKRALRRFARTRLPGEIIARPKQGFPVPVYEWLGNGLKPWASELLTSSDTRLSAWLQPESVRAQLQLGTTRDCAPIERHRLWNLLILELWMREWRPQ